jgi:hypothetical protein
MIDAACVGIPSEIFHPEPGDDWQQAVAVCGGCPVRLQCLEWAMTVETTLNQVPFGIYGGVTARRRSKLIKQMTHKRCRDCHRLVTRAGGRVWCDECSARRRRRSEEDAA